MTNEIPEPAEKNPAQCDQPFHRSLCWKAVLAGTVVGVGIFVLLGTLGLGAGLTIFRPMPESNLVTHFSSVAAVGWSLGIIIALSCGGWVAGRYSGCLRSGLMHGVLVWGLALILAVPFFGLGTGVALWRARNNHHENVRASSQVAAVAAAELADTMAKRDRDQRASFVKEAVQSIPTNAAPKAATRAKREVGFAVDKLFAPGNAAAFAANRLETINALMAYTDMNAADATTTMDAWVASHKNLQAELDKAKAEGNSLGMAAEQAAQANADTILIEKTDHIFHGVRWSFFALLIGLLGASLSGRCGARCAARNPDERYAPVTTA